MSERTVSQSLSGKRVLTVEPETSAYDAACIMTRANCGSVLVVANTGAMVGILTERDLMTKVVARALDPVKTTAADIMTPQPRFVGPDTRVADAVLIMKEGGFRHLPILASAGKIVGMFSIRDATPQEISEANRQAQYAELVEDAVGY